MEIVKLSDNYQVVIPKLLRRQLNLKPGERMSVHLDEKDRLIVERSADALEALQVTYGGRGVWGKDPTKTVRQMRDEWESKA